MQGLEKDENVSDENNHYHGDIVIKQCTLHRECCPVLLRLVLPSTMGEVVHLRYMITFYIILCDLGWRMRLAVQHERSILQGHLI